MKISGGQFSIGSLMILIAIVGLCCSVPELTLHVLIPIVLIGLAFLVGFACCVTLTIALVERADQWMDRRLRDPSESRIATETKPIEPSS